jgi:hypothetical protein
MTSTTCLSLLSYLVTIAGAMPGFVADKPNEINFPVQEARFLRFVIHASLAGQTCIDELEVYGPDSLKNLAAAAQGARATASSCLPGYAIHRIAHLNDGLYGNDHSWIAAGAGREWAQIEFKRAVLVNKVIFSRDREGHFQDRLPDGIEILISADGANWTTVARSSPFPILAQGESRPEKLLRYAFACEDLSWHKLDSSDSVDRVLRQMEAMLLRFSAQGLDVSRERAELLEFHERLRGLKQGSVTEREELFFKARLAKRRLFLRAPELAGLQRILFVKRQPFLPSHNYSVILDAAGGPGGGICILDIPRTGDSLDPSRARVTTLFSAGQGIARDPSANFAASKVFFSYRVPDDGYYHLYEMNVDGTECKQITQGPFHDTFPCALPDGGLCFISTRCRARFLCWRPQAFVLFRMDCDRQNIQALSHANLSEWTPSVMNDGRIIWMRSEYLDKGADFGHTLWAIRPDGTHPELIFGNNTLNCYANGREVPDSDEILCTLVSHGGDLNGPLALIRAKQGRFNSRAIENITPDVAPHYHMSWAQRQCFRDPVPISRNYFLCSHAPLDSFGLYIVDRYGNRELIYLDPDMGSMSPTLLQPRPTPPVLGGLERPEQALPDQGQFFVADVYQGLEPSVERGRIKYIRVCQELRADLAQLSTGEYQADHEAFQDWYATPTHKVSGPHGWPSYVAKANLGLVPVEADGSAHFYAPAGKVLYFQVLDEDYNEIQRMRSVVQLQAGEKRSCIGCHEDRMAAPSAQSARALAAQREPSRLQAPSWGTGPFSYEKVVQPVWDAQCVRCHNAEDEQAPDLAGTLDADGVPASYRTLIERGWVHYFDFTWGQEHSKAEALSFGTVRSPLWQILKKGHYATLTPDQMQRVKCWTDLNCPLWPDYIYRPLRLHAKIVKK